MLTDLEFQFWGQLSTLLVQQHKIHINGAVQYEKNDLTIWLHAVGKT